MSKTILAQTRKVEVIQYGYGDAFKAKILLETESERELAKRAIEFYQKASSEEIMNPPDYVQRFEKWFWAWLKLSCVPDYAIEALMDVAIWIEDDYVVADTGW